jgi:hypothetical protein
MKQTLAASALMIIACGGDAQTAGLDLPDDPSAVILTIEDVGGFAMVPFVLNRPPRLVLSADRRAIIEGPQIAIFPGPLLPNMQVAQLDEETFLFALEEIASIGFPDIGEEVNDEASNTVADAPTTVVTFYDTAGRHRFSVYALGIGAQVNDERVPILANLVQVLTDEAYSSPTVPFQAERVQVYAGEEPAVVEPGFSSVQDWPLPDGFGAMSEVVAGWRCVFYEGEVAAALLAVFSQANQATRWDESGTEYTLLPRPLLPGEEACTASALG